MLRSFGRGLRALNMTSKASVKQSQHFATLYVGRNMLRPFGHPVAKCCDMLCLVGSSLKPRPNDRNISIQHIPTLLAQHLQAPAKRSQHFSTTYRNIVGRNLLSAFRYLVTTCWVLKIEIKRMPGCNIVAGTWPVSNLSQQHPTCMSQHVATHRNRVAKRVQHVAPNNVAMCYVEMLRSFGRGLKTVKFEPTTTFISQDIATGWSNMLRCNVLRWHVAIV